MRTAKVPNAKRARGNVPRFKSIEEESEFWDTHSFLDFGSWEPVPYDDVCRSLSFVKGPKVPVTFRLERSLVQGLKEAARQYGIKYQVLARKILWRSLSKRAGARRKGAGAGARGSRADCRRPGASPSGTRGGRGPKASA